MGTRTNLAANLTSEAATAGLDAGLISDHPPSMGPVAVPALFVAPGEPWLVPSGPGLYTIRLDAVVYVGRLDTATAWDDLEAWVPVVKAAAVASELRWASAAVGVETVGSVDYVTARVSLEGETATP